MRFRDTAWFMRRHAKSEAPEVTSDDTHRFGVHTGKTQKLPPPEELADRQDELAQQVTTKIWMFDETVYHGASIDPDALDQANDPELTMQLRAVRGDRRPIVALLIGALVALGSGIALVL
jgi:hypothetical protein